MVPSFVIFKGFNGEKAIKADPHHCHGLSESSSPMKLIQNLGIALIVCCLAIAINSQLQSPGSATPDGNNILAARSTNLGEQAVLVDFADRVVVPTYQQLAAKTEILYQIWL